MHINLTCGTLSLALYSKITLNNPKTKNIRSSKWPLHISIWIKAFGTYFDVFWSSKLDHQTLNLKKGWVRNFMPISKAPTAYCVSLCFQVWYMLLLFEIDRKVRTKSLPIVSFHSIEFQMTNNHLESNLSISSSSFLCTVCFKCAYLLIELRFVNCLKFWIVGFLSFETICSLPQNDLGKCSRFHFKVRVCALPDFVIEISMCTWLHLLQTSSFIFACPLSVPITFIPHISCVLPLLGSTHASQVPSLSLGLFTPLFYLVENDSCNLHSFYPLNLRLISK